MWRALCIVLALSPTYLIRFRVGEIPFTVLEVLIFVLCVAVAARVLFQKKIHQEYTAQLKKISPLVWSAGIIFVCAAVASVFVAPDVRPALGIFRAYIIEALCIGVIAFLEYREPRQLRELILWSSATVFLVSAYAIFQMFTGWGIPNPYWAAAATRRATSIFGYPNATGLYVEFSIPLLVAGGWVMRGKTRAWLWGVALIAVAGFLCGKSAGASAAVFGTALIFLLVWHRTRVWTAAIIGVCAIIIAATPLRTPFAQQFLLQGFSGGLRIQMWKETAQMLQERPIAGAGLAAYQQRVTPFHENKRVEIYLYPHNLVLTLWSELGLFGLISFAIIFGFVAWRIFLAARKKINSVEARVWSAALLAIFLIWFIHGIVDTPYFKNDFSAWYWAIIAIGLHLGYTESPCVSKFLR